MLFSLAGGGPWRLVSRLSLCLALAACSTEQAGAALFATDDMTSVVRAREWGGALVQSTELANPLADFIWQWEEPTVTPESLEKMLVRMEKAAVGMDCTTPSLPSRTEGHLLAEFARLEALYSGAPDADGLRRFYRLNRDKYPPNDQVSGWRLKVENLPDSSTGEDATATLAWAKGRMDAGISFPQVCAEYHLRRGEKEVGQFGPLDPAGLEPAEGAAVLSAPLGEVTGPVRLDDATIIFRVDTRVTSDGDPAAQMGERLLNDYVSVRWRRGAADRATSLTKALKLELRDYDTSSPLGPRQVAFLLNGRDVTFAETRQLLPPLVGDERDPRFWPSVAHRAVEHEQWRAWGESQGMRENPAFVRLKEALASSVCVAQHLDELTSAPARKELEKYFQGHAKDIEGSKRVSGMEFRFRTASPGAPPSPNVARLQRESDLSTLRGVARRWVESPTTAVLEKAKREYPTVTWREMSGVAVDTLPRELEIVIDQTPVGETTPAVRADDGYVLVVVRSKEAGALPPFASVKGRVEAQWRNEVIKGWMAGTRH